jgi:hypothetical protein
MENSPRITKVITSEPEIYPEPAAEVATGYESFEKIAKHVYFDPDTNGQIQRAYEITEEGQSIDLEDDPNSEEATFNRAIILQFENPDLGKDDHQLFISDRTIYNLDYFDLSPEERKKTSPMWQIEENSIKFPKFTIGDKQKPEGFPDGFPEGPINKVFIRTDLVPKSVLSRSNVDFKQRGQDPFIEANKIAKRIREYVGVDSEPETQTTEVLVAHQEPATHQMPSERDTQPLKVTRNKPELRALLPGEKQAVYLPDQNGDYYIGSIFNEKGSKLPWGEMPEARRLNRKVVITTDAGDEFYMFGDSVFYSSRNGLLLVDSLAPDKQPSELEVGKSWKLAGGLTGAVKSIEIFDRKVQAGDEDVQGREVIKDNIFEEYDELMAEYRQSKRQGPTRTEHFTETVSASLQKNRQKLGQVAVKARRVKKELSTQTGNLSGKTLLNPFKNTINKIKARPTAEHSRRQRSDWMGRQQQQPPLNSRAELSLVDPDEDDDSNEKNKIAV